MLLICIHHHHWESMAFGFQHASSNWPALHTGSSGASHQGIASLSTKELGARRRDGLFFGHLPGRAVWDHGLSHESPQVPESSYRSRPSWLGYLCCSRFSVMILEHVVLRLCYDLLLEASIGKLRTAARADKNLICLLILVVPKRNRARHLRRSCN